MKNQRFGVEVELDGLPVSEARGVIRAYFGGDYDHLGRRWSIERDGSVPRGFELVTPPIYYADLFTLQEVFRRLRWTGARRAAAAGLHVHVNAGDFSVEQVTSLLNLYVSHSDLVLRMCEVLPARRIIYAQPVEPFAELVESAAPKSLERMKDLWYQNGGANEEPISRYNSTRYTELNLNSLFYRGTIEFRAFNSTNHAGKLRSTIVLVLAMVEFAKKFSGVFPLADPLSRRLVTNARLQEFFDLLALNADEFRVVRAHLRENVMRGLARKHHPTSSPVAFRWRGMEFEGVSHSAALDEMWDNGFFDFHDVRIWLSQLRKRGKSPQAKDWLLRLSSSPATYEQYAQAILCRLQEDGLGSLDGG